LDLVLIVDQQGRSVGRIPHGRRHTPGRHHQRCCRRL